jgi:hypothetical protein
LSVLGWYYQRNILLFIQSLKKKRNEKKRSSDDRDGGEREERGDNMMLLIPYSWLYFACRCHLLFLQCTNQGQWEWIMETRKRTSSNFIEA